MELIHLLRWVHVIGATVLLGTGAGIAFFMLMAHRTGKPALIAHVASTVVIADFVFTASAVVVQPITGFALARMLGYPLSEGWILVSLALYLATGAFWLPVVWIQMQLWIMAQAAAERGAEVVCRNLAIYLSDGSLASALNRNVVEAARMTGGRA